MSHSGVRKRLRVRWLHEVAEGLDTHAFHALTNGKVSDHAMCGLPLKSMHLWSPTTNSRAHGQCRACKQAMSKGGRA